MSTPEPYIPLESLRSASLRRELDSLARKLLETKQEIRDYLDPLKPILDPLEAEQKRLQSEINSLASKLPPTSRRILAHDPSSGLGWRMYYRRGRTTLSESRLLERGVDISDIKAARVEGQGSYIVTSIETGPSDPESGD